ncbi:hypothetical protein TB9_03440 [Xanthomonas perforans]|uniref:Uncharacterized protein n=1 Tax=Xanthomonas perforans TaxID=442694 RepID=A0ABR5EQN2_XANPE|nr:hypothetical protein XEU66b_07965 [Xanthomonas euvesicatoria]KLC04387.1 hypothetical protein XP315_15290 [Xanthomonas perforans]KHL67015.1 hypothetical protein XEU83M_03360 [Xanthomonas euvesicatoria]KLA54663.1 hypothetical protein XEUV683_06850 [Xanthomonas euvesicatoria]KLA59645.1 hypothetical protein XEUV685_03285 [Xanthomonas euvesicatoria]
MNGIGGQGVNQQPAECAAVHLRSERADRALSVEQNRAVLVTHALGVLAREDEGQEGVVEACRG